MFERSPKEVDELRKIVIDKDGLSLKDITSIEEINTDASDIWALSRVLRNAANSASGSTPPMPIWTSQNNQV